MRVLIIITMSALMIGCSSAPKQTEPEGKVTPVYILQDELNERDTWRTAAEKKAKQDLQQGAGL